MLLKLFFLLCILCGSAKADETVQKLLTIGKIDEINFSSAPIEKLTKYDAKKLQVDMGNSPTHWRVVPLVKGQATLDFYLLQGMKYTIVYETISVGEKEMLDEIKDSLKPYSEVAVSVENGRITMRGTGLSLAALNQVKQIKRTYPAKLDDKTAPGKIP